MSQIQEASAPATAAPAWVKLLTMATGRLFSSARSLASGPRLVVAAPSPRHIPAVTALTALRRPEDQSATTISSGMRVATVLLRKLNDVEVSMVRGRWVLGTITFDESLKPLPPLALVPDSFDLDRSPVVVPAAAFEHLGALGYSEVAEWTYLRLCLRPVVILTNRPSQVVADLQDLRHAAEWWNPAQMAALIEPESGAHMWFRRPVIVMTPAAALAEVWLSQMAVALVVVAGYSAWNSAARHAWESAPQVLLINQRSSDVADFREWFDGAEFPALDLPFGNQFRRAGITLTAFNEPVGLRDEVVETEESNEWLF